MKMDWGREFQTETTLQRLNVSLVLFTDIFTNGCLLVEHNSTSHWCCRLWITAHHCGILYLISKLEAVQHFAAIVVTHRWHDSHSKLLASLKWPSLQKRRLKQKLSLCSRIVGDHSIIPVWNSLPFSCLLVYFLSKKVSINWLFNKLIFISPELKIVLS